MARPRMITWEDQNVLDQVYELVINGNTFQEIADHFGIARKTFENNHRNNEALKGAVKKARADKRNTLYPIIESSLIKSAKGFFVKEPKITKKWIEIKNEKTGKYELTGEIEVTEVIQKKYIPSNVTAQIFWLCNNSEGEYISINKTEHTIKGDMTYTLKADGDFDDIAEEDIEIIEEEENIINVEDDK